MRPLLRLFIVINSISQKMPRVAKKVDPAATETWRKNVVEAVTELVKEVEAPAEVAEAPAPAPAAAPAAAEKKKVVRVVK
jgi:hypothetical protein